MHCHARDRSERFEPCRAFAHCAALGRPNAARRGDWQELDRDRLERYGRYLVYDGKLYLPAHGAVLHGDGNYPDSSDAVAFYVDDKGEPIFLTTPTGATPRTLALLQAEERERAARSASRSFQPLLRAFSHEILGGR